MTFCKGRIICDAVEFDLGHNDDSVWQARHFECIGLIFRGRRNTL